MGLTYINEMDARNTFKDLFKTYIKKKMIGWTIICGNGSKSVQISSLFELFVCYIGLSAPSVKIGQGHQGHVILQGIILVPFAENLGELFAGRPGWLFVLEDGEGELTDVDIENRIQFAGLVRFPKTEVWRFGSDHPAQEHAYPLAGSLAYRAESCWSQPISNRGDALFHIQTLQTILERQFLIRVSLAKRHKGIIDVLAYLDEFVTIERPIDTVILGVLIAIEI